MYVMQASLRAEVSMYHQQQRRKSRALRSAQASPDCARAGLESARESVEVSLITPSKKVQKIRRLGCVQAGLEAARQRKGVVRI